VSIPAILLVEDNPQTSRLFNKVLVNADCVVHAALTLHEAQRLFREHTFALMVLDLHMPDGNGLEFLRHHQKIIEQNRTKVIVISAEDYRAECDGLGVHLYLDKPILPSSLSNIVQQLLGKQPQNTDRGGWRSQFLD
jgi:DNA-binding response OmpR family regulator